MIRQETVFIIGAGASVPYGYPTGEELRMKIIDSQQVWTNLLPMSWQPIAEKFVDVFDRSGNKSIDLFLSRNQEFKDVGKFAIVNSIIDYEAASHAQRKVRNAPNNWYSYLFQEMTKELTTKADLDKFADNKVTFITLKLDGHKC